MTIPTTRTTTTNTQKQIDQHLTSHTHTHTPHMIIIITKIWQLTAQKYNCFLCIYKNYTKIRLELGHNYLLTICIQYKYVLQLKHHKPLSLSYSSVYFTPMPTITIYHIPYPLRYFTNILNRI